MIPEKDPETISGMVTLASKEKVTVEFTDGRKDTFSFSKYEHLQGLEEGDYVIATLVANLEEIYRGTSRKVIGVISPT